MDWKTIGVAVAAIGAGVLGGCASPATPLVWADGNYYMSGDSDCATGHLLPPGANVGGYVYPNGALACANARKEFTGQVRPAMTLQQLQMYQMRASAQQAEIAALTQQLNQTSEAFRRNAETMRSMAPYTPPQVAPIAPPGGNQVRCIGAGIYTNCRY